MDRRTFLRNSAAATVGASTLPLAAAAAAPKPSRVERYRRLGRTGLEISDISLGSAGLKDPDTVRHALERGINYFDTAEMYGEGDAERVLGQVLPSSRDKVYIASKVFAEADARKEKIMAALEGSLTRLRTDYVDVYFNHAINDVARMQNPEWHEFVALAKEQGKIRFSGMSGHGGYLRDCLDDVLDRDGVDVILVAHNFGTDPAFYERFTKGFDFVAKQPGLPRLLAKAKTKDVGVIAMKTLMGARLNDMRPYEWGGATFAQAAFRWVFQQADVDALIVSMKESSLIDEYLVASGQTEVRVSDRRLLDAYVAANTEAYCRNGCSDCSGGCPAAVAIPDVLRARMYAVDYGDLEFAKQSYEAVAVNADACTSCTAPVCLDACSFGLPVDKLALQAKTILG
ncbi:MAG: putative aldo/keto reductase-like oxidoreductase [Myxococcota bacterium]|jgi:predicted aldo/keto reductase-like oxidoreductase